LVARRTKAAADFDAVDPREAEIKDHGVVLVAHGEVQTGRTLARQIGFVTRAAEGALDGVSDSGLILDQKDTHLCRVYERVR